MNDLSSAVAARVDAAIDAALARSVLYRTLTLGLRPPGPDEPTSAFSPPGRSAVRDAATLLDAGGSPGESLLPVVEDLCRRAVSPAERLVAHARLFGHSRGLVCPFETEYGAGGEFRQPQELADLAGTYLAFGLKPREGGDERVDHVACECEFMDFLGRKEAFALAFLRTSDAPPELAEGVATVQGATRGFLRDHLGRFGRAFATLLMREDTAGFHGALGALLFRFLTLESRRFGLAPGPASLELRPPVPDETPMACGRPTDELIQIGRRTRP